MKNTNLFVVDRDLSNHSRQIVNKYNSSLFFTVKDIDFSIDKAEKELFKDEADAIIVFEKGFGNSIDKQEPASVQILVNAIDASAASLFDVYIRSVIGNYNSSIITEINNVKKTGSTVQIVNTYSHLYNPEMDYIPYMLPGILVLLVTVIGLFLSAMNVVREKEIGTIEQINVTPIKKHHFLIGKLIPFLIIGFFELGVGLLLAAFVFQIPFLGSAFLIYLVAFVYLLTILGLGLLISTLTDTQQQAMFIAWFLMVIFIMMCGLFTPVESMPEWGQKLNLVNPVAYFIRIIRMIMLKGSGFMDIIKDFGILCIYALLMLSFAVNRYRKVA
jgi:ABC-type multidrug transport system, permease component